MPPVFLGEGKGLADEASDALAQGVVPAFHVRGLPGLLADTAVSLLREDRRIGFPEVTEAAALAVGFRHPLPKCPAGGLTVVAVGEATIWRVSSGGTSLSRASACSCAATRTTRPRQVRHITGLGREQGFLDGGQAQEFFLTTA